LAYWLALLLAGSCALSCNRLGAAGSAEKSASGSEALPFHGDAAPPGESSELHPLADDRGLPFRAHPARVLPAGTLITVRLDHALDGSVVHAGDAFTAVVAEPVTSDGQTLVARGALVTGAIESTQRSISPRRSGYIRLILNDLTVDGKELPLQTSSLFEGARHALASDNSSTPSSVRLPPGRRLTFRLTSAIMLDEQSVHGRQDAIPSSE
jgi:hypothetical protein